MTTTSRNVRRADLSALATLFVVILAVFAMHGLAGHDLAHGDSAGSAIPAVSAVLADAATSEVAGHDHAGQASKAPAYDTPGDPEEKGHLDVGVCLALLSLIAALILLQLRRGLTFKPLFVLKRSTWAPVLRSRFVDPPCLHRLSIMRC